MDNVVTSVISAPGATTLTRGPDKNMYTLRSPRGDLQLDRGAFLKTLEGKQGACGAKRVNRDDESVWIHGDHLVATYDKSTILCLASEIIAMANALESAWVEGDYAIARQFGGPPTVLIRLTNIFENGSVDVQVKWQGLTEQKAEGQVTTAIADGFLSGRSSMELEGRDLRIIFGETLGAIYCDDAAIGTVSIGHLTILRMRLAGLYDILR